MRIRASMRLCLYHSTDRSCDSGVRAGLCAGIPYTICHMPYAIYLAAAQVYHTPYAICHMPYAIYLASAQVEALQEQFGVVEASKANDSNDLPPWPHGANYNRAKHAALTCVAVCARRCNDEKCQGVALYAALELVLATVPAVALYPYGPAPLHCPPI